MKQLVLGLTILLVVVAGYAVYLQLEVSRLERLVAAEPEPGAEDKLEYAASQQQKEASDETVTSLDAVETATVSMEANSPEAPSETQPEVSREDRRRARAQHMAAIFNDPQIRADMVERQINRIDERYARFFKTLSLSNEEMDTLRTLMAERNVLNWESRTRRFGAESDEERDLIEAERSLQREVLSEEIESLLGQENSDALKDFSESLPYRNAVDALASSLSFTETPLSESQSEALVTSLKAASETFKYTRDLSDMRGPEMQGVSSQDIDTYFSERAERDALFLEAASETLEDAQLAALAERQLAERERDRRQMEFMQENPPPSRGWGRGPGR